MKQIYMIQDRGKHHISPKDAMVSGTSYIINTDGLKSVYEVIRALLTTREVPLMVTHTNPAYLKERFKFENTEMLWITSLPGENQIDASKIGMISDTMISHVKKWKEKALLIVDSMEIMILYNDFIRTMRTINTVHENVMAYQALMIIFLSKNAFDRREWAILSRFFEELFVTGKP